MPDGTATAIVWEIAEYVAFIRNSTEFETAYINRLGNLTLGIQARLLPVTWPLLHRAEEKEMVLELLTGDTAVDNGG